MADIDARLAGIETGLEEVKALLTQLAATKAAEEKDAYSVEEVAELVGRSPYQVRCWARDGRIGAEKSWSGRGPHKGWIIPREALVEYRSRGLRSAAGGR